MGTMGSDHEVPPLAAPGTWGMFFQERGGKEGDCIRRPLSVGNFRMAL